MAMNGFSSLHAKVKKPRRVRGGELVLHTTFCRQEYHIRQWEGEVYMPRIYKGRKMSSHSCIPKRPPAKLTAVGPPAEVNAVPTCQNEHAAYGGDYLTWTRIPAHMLLVIMSNILCKLTPF